MALQLIVVAELCRADSEGMPPEVLAAVVPSLVTLACSGPEPHSVSAATCLAAGMTGRCADVWRLHLGNLQVLTERCGGQPRCVAHEGSVHAANEHTLSCAHST